MARPDTQTQLAIEMIRKRVDHADHIAYRFPGERGLAVELGLSRQTVRRAITQLVEEGLLQRGPTGRLMVRQAFANDNEEAPRLIAFLNPGGGSPETRLWLAGMSAALSGRRAILRSLSYEHYSDPAISAALEGFDGVFFLPRATASIPAWLIERLKLSRPRVVVIDQDESAHGLRSVIVFPFAAGNKLLEHLQGLGHRQIDCFSVEPMNSVITARIAIWRDYLDHHGLTGELISHDGQGSLPEAHNCFSQHLASQPSARTALYCTTINAAMGSMRAIHEQGWQSGKDISVCAVNDEGFGPYLIPSLTCLWATPRTPHLRKAVRWLLTGEGWSKPSLHQPKQSPLFIGESTGSALALRRQTSS